MSSGRRIREKLFGAVVDVGKDDGWVNVSRIVKESVSSIRGGQVEMKERMKRIEERLGKIEEVMKGKVERGEFKKYCKRSELEMLSRSTIKDVKEAFKIFKGDNMKQVEVLSREITGIKKNLLVKSSMKDVMTLLKDKMSRTSFHHYIKEQKVINHMVISQNTIGRWVWNNQTLKNNKGIPFNVEVMNTNRANFVWKKNHCNILVLLPGLYNLCYSFFNFGGEIESQIYVNGSPVFSKVVKSRLFSSFNDFIVIKENTKIALSIICKKSEKNIEGFLSLRKL